MSIHIGDIPHIALTLATVVLIFGFIITSLINSRSWGVVP